MTSARVASLEIKALASSLRRAFISAMIAFLRGKLVEAMPHRAIVDVGGVGYLTNIPLTTFDRLPQQGGEVTLLTHHHVTEREHTLFGFFTNDERDLFRLLMDRVSGIGPKMALSVLSGMPVAAFKDAVIRNDTAALARIKGVGKKTAERIVLELKDKVGVVDAWQAAQVAKGTHDPRQEAMSDAVLGLIALGYKQSEAQKAINDLVKVSGFDPATSADKLIREALRVLQ
jgi:Holliday junction DNA helicase RuvA